MTARPTVLRGERRAEKAEGLKEPGSGWLHDTPCMPVPVHTFPINPYWGWETDKDFPDGLDPFNWF